MSVAPATAIVPDPATGRTFHLAFTMGMRAWRVYSADGSRFYGLCDQANWKSVGPVVAAAEAKAAAAAPAPTPEPEAPQEWAPKP